MSFIALTNARLIGSAVRSRMKPPSIFRKLHREILQVGERREARAEIVQRKPEAFLAQPLHQRARGVEVG